MSESNQENSIQRRLVHNRTFDVKAYRREDDLWDIEAQITDLKNKDVKMSKGVRKLGEPIHQMLLKITINTKFEVLESKATTIWAPYMGHCENITPDYSKLVGLNLLKGFREGAKERLGGILGCTHITEITKILPTVAFQAFVGEVYQVDGTTETVPATKKYPPVHLNGCHALRTDGPVVQSNYPVWYGYPVPESKKPA